jgi:lipopolysaccharide biosynthesis regulator YciM
MATKNYRRTCTQCGFKGRKIKSPGIGKMNIRCPKCKRWGCYSARVAK